MRSKYLTICGLVLMSVATAAHAEDDSVYVDFSVLDSLGSATYEEFAAEPAFPPYVEKAKKAAKKPIIKKAVKKPEVKVEVIAEQEVVPAPVAEPVIEAKPVFAATPQTSAEPVIEEQPVDVEPVSEPVKAGSVAEVITGPAPLPEPEPIVKAEEPAIAPVAEPEVKTEETAEVVAAPQNAFNEIVFADGNIDLTNEQKLQINQILAGFEDYQNNKIGIVSYNTQTGEEVFKKRRESLERAISVRAYLLTKDIKSFSVQVVNAAGNNKKTNVVELNEIK